MFMEGIELYGKDWKKVQQYVGTRTSAQSRSHAQKVLSKSSVSKTGSTDLTPAKTEAVPDNESSQCIAKKINQTDAEVGNENSQISRKRLHSFKAPGCGELVENYKRK
jgi:hypothetical protein